MGDADLRLIPSAVGGDREKRTGVILAKSIPAKKFGIRTGEPVAMALRKCPDLVLAPPDFHLYESCSAAFMDICREYAPVVEKYSIDECFLDMSGTDPVYPDPIATAFEIKDKIRDTLGFTVNIGMGPNKLLAKMASDFEKPDRIHTLFSHELDSKFYPLPVGQLFSVGGATAARLEKAYIRTIGDLARADLRRLQGLVGVKAGIQLHDYANGINNSPVLSEAEKAKGYSVSVTLEEDITEPTAAAAVLLELADSVAARMRADGEKTSCISVSIRSNEFLNRSHQIKLETATDVTNEIFHTAKRLFYELWDGRTPLRLLGLSLTGLMGEEEQFSFFEDERHEKDRAADKAVDKIRSRFGSDVISWGTSFQSGVNAGKKYKAQNDLNSHKK